jgi:hypothetical protein
MIGQANRGQILRSRPRDSIWQRSRTASGSAFFPGIEAGEFLISDPALYSRAFRLDPAKVKPGDVSARMALPWQSDFFACQKLWWPPARPNSVRPEGGGAAVDWDAAVPDRKAMVDHWSELGFVLRSGDEYLLTEACAPSFVHLLTPQLVFKDIPRGPTGMSRKTALAIVFEVHSPGAAVTLEFKSGPVHPRLQRLGATSVSVGPTAGSGIVHARLWLTYETGAPGESITDSVTVSRPGTTEEWVIKLSASTVERKKSAAALVLDRSGSMAEDMGGGTTCIQGLREAAQIFVDVMLQDDGVALVRFNQAADELKPVTVLGSPADPFDPGRAAIKASVTGPDLNPAGQTSIGAGIVKGRTALNSVTGFDFKSMLVFTDGKENHAPLIADGARRTGDADGLLAAVRGAVDSARTGLGRCHAPGWQHFPARLYVAVRGRIRRRFQYQPGRGVRHSRACGRFLSAGSQRAAGDGADGPLPDRGRPWGAAFRSDAAAVRTAAVWPANRGPVGSMDPATERAGRRYPGSAELPLPGNQADRRHLS